MAGSIWVLLVALLVFMTTLLMQRLIDGHWSFARLPVTWFYASWLLGLTLLALPIFRYFEVFSGESGGYLLGVLASFSFGTVAAAFAGRRASRLGFTRGARGQTVIDTHDVPARLLMGLLAVGAIGTAVIMTNVMLGGGLSLADRLDSDNFSEIREAAFTSTGNRIGLLFGPANLMSAIGGLGVAYSLFLYGARNRNYRYARWILPLSLLLVALNVFVGFVGFGSRMFAIFGILIAFFAFMEGRWSIGERLIAKRPSLKSVAVIMLSTALTAAAMWVAATSFLEQRVQRQDPQHLMYRTHRATLAPLAYDMTRDDKTLQYFMLSVSYLSTPIPTLAFYLDLPAARQPGPFYGEYNFPAVWRWGRRLLFSGDPFAWERARYDIFKPLGDIGFGMNVWSTLVRDLIADFGKWGALLFLAGIGFLAQRVFDRQREAPTMQRAGLLVYLRLLLVFAGLISMLFMAQVYWPLYLAGLLAATAGRKSRRVATLTTSRVRPAAARS